MLFDSKYYLLSHIDKASMFIESGTSPRFSQSFYILVAYTISIDLLIVQKSNNTVALRNHFFLRRDYKLYQIKIQTDHGRFCRQLIEHFSLLKSYPFLKSKVSKFINLGGVVDNLTRVKIQGQVSWLCCHYR